MVTCKHLALVMAALVCGARSEAAESPGGPTVGGVTPVGGASAVKLKTVQLHVTLRHVSFEQRFVNETNRMIVQDVEIRGPDTGYDRANDSWYELENLKVTINGRALPLRPIHAAFEPASTHPSDVTARLMRAGLHVSTFGGMQDVFRVGADGGRNALWPRSEVGRLSQSVRDELVAAGLLSTDPDPMPLWVVRTRYQWVQEFPPGVPVVVRTEYTPPMAVEEGATETTYAKEACLGGDRLPKAEYIASWVTLRLAALSMWNGPIDSVELEGTASKDHVGACWEGSVTRAESAVIARAERLVPRKDVTVFFFAKDLRSER